MAASASGDGGSSVRNGMRRKVDYCDDGDDVRKGGRRFKMAGTPNLHLHSFPCLVDRARDGSRHSFPFSVPRLIRLKELN
jgi:hypothetical protein